MSEPLYVNVSVDKYHAMVRALLDAPHGQDGRFTGTMEQQNALAAQMRDMFDGPPVVGIPLKREDVMDLADDLALAGSNWSLGQYSAILSTLADWSAV